MERGGRTVAFEDTQDLVSSNKSHLGDTMRVTEGNTNLGGGKTLSGEFGNVVDNILRGGLQPGRGCAAIRQSRRRCNRNSEKVIKVAISIDYSQIPFPGACIRPMAA